MRYLIFLDWSREALVWVFLVVLLFAAGVIVWAPGIKKSMAKLIVRTFGLTMFAARTLLFSLFVLIAVSDHPRERTVFVSKTGARVALLSHSELRDSAATRVTVKGEGFRTYFVYEYFGEDDDYMDKASVRWLDDNHLEITYAVDTSGTQQCHSRAGDVSIVCHPHPAPISPNNQRN